LSLALYYVKLSRENQFLYWGKNWNCRWFCSRFKCWNVFIPVYHWVYVKVADETLGG